MVKGVNKLIVEVSNPDSELFERAIFFVRPQMKDTPPTELSKGADALIRARSEKPPRSERRRARVLSAFALIGTAGLGAAIAVAVITFL